MALNSCTSCTTKFAAGLSKCPHCGSTKYVEDGDVMAKITRHGGASDDTVPAPEEETEAVAAPASEPDVEEEPAIEPESVNEEGGEESSPGSSSSASTETPQPNSEPSEPQTLSPAPTTGSRSRKGRTGNRSAPSTDGGQETGTSAAESE